MPDTITIDPVSRIEGHAKITLRLNRSGAVADARFHVTEFRGFEEFCKGRPLWEMPSLTARTCGICPVSHLMASSKAGDAILSVRIPPAAEALRRLMNLGQIVQSHALSFFHLSAPDLLLGMDSDPASRNVFGLIGAEPELARRGIRLRQFGQDEVLVYRPGGIVVIGNGRLMAARELSADDKRFEYLAAYELDEDQQTSVCRAIAHNRTAETSAWDKNVLRALVKPLRETAEAKAMGWSDAELKRLLDDIEAPPQSPKTTKQIKFTLDIATCDALVAHLKTFADKRDEAIAIWLAQSTGKAARK